MKLAVIYASKYGQARKVAREIERIAERENVTCLAHDVRLLPADFNLRAYDGVVLVGSVYLGRLARALREFVIRHRAALSGMHTALVSVGTSAIHEKDRPEAEACLERFVQLTGWTPDRRACFAGAIAYTKYGLITRFVMKRIAGKTGLSTDTRRDHEFTNWAAVESFVRDFIGEALEAGTSQAVAGALA